MTARSKTIIIRLKYAQAALSADDYLHPRGFLTSILPRMQLDAAVWNRFADESSEAWLWHRWEAIDAYAAWDGWSDASFAIEDDGRLAAIVPLHLHRRKVKGILPWSMLHSVGGAATAGALTPGNRDRVLAAAVAEIDRLGVAAGAVEADCLLPPMAPAWRGPACPRVNPLLLQGWSNSLTQCYVVDLRCGEQALWAGLEYRARKAVRKAERAGVTVREGGSADLEAYWDLHLRTYGRTGARHHARAYFEEIFTRLLPAGLCRVWFGERDGRIIAAQNFGLYKGAALYWTAASADEALDSGANNFVHWQAMRTLAAEGVGWLETGEAFPHIRRGKLKGLNDFKRGFGGALYPIYRGRLAFRRRAVLLFDALSQWGTP